jgi:hypothetical protein
MNQNRTLKFQMKNIGDYFTDFGVEDFLNETLNGNP